MSWWNALREEQRAYWLREADTAIVAEAWAHYQRVLSQPRLSATALLRGMWIRPL
jgi:hypothetical protein